MATKPTTKQIQTGWVCPRCDRANAPNVTTCECSPTGQVRSDKTVERVIERVIEREVIRQYKPYSYWPLPLYPYKVVPVPSMIWWEYSPTITYSNGTSNNITLDGGNFSNVLTLDVGKE